MKGFDELARTQGIFMGGLIVDDWVYYSAGFMNGLFRQNIYTEEIEFLCRFDKYDTWLKVHEEAFRIGDDLYFLPLGHVKKIIAIYCLNTGCVDYIELPKSPIYQEGRVAAGVIKTEGVVWVVPCEYDAILRLDIETREIKRCDQWPAKVRSHGLAKHKFTSSVLIGDEIYLCPYDCPDVVVFNVKTEKMRLLKTEVENKTYKKMFCFRDEIYLVPEYVSNPMLICDLNMRIKERVCIIPSEKEIDGSYNAIICTKKGVLWMFPYNGKYIIEYNLLSRKTEIIDFCLERNFMPSYWNADIFGDKILVSMLYSQSPYLIVEEDNIGSYCMHLGKHVLSVVNKMDNDEKRADKNKTIGKEIYYELSKKG